MAATNGSNRNGRKGTSRAHKKTNSARVVARAVAMLVAGSAVAEVAQKLDIPQRTVSEWKDLVPAEFARIRPKKEIVHDLLSEYLVETIKTNLEQLKIFRDEKWVRRQSAGELATLHGVLFDKFVRFFEAARLGEPVAGELLPSPDDQR